MRKGLYTDAAYRFRKNEYIRNDHWYPSPDRKIDFYDVIKYNYDTYEVDENWTKISYIYFKLNTDKVVHVRNVYNLVDYFGALGGISDLLSKTVLFVMGSYLSFYSSTEIILALYYNTENKFCWKTLSHLQQELKISTCTRWQIYIFSHFGCLKCCCKKTKLF